ncbi:hypothetical protein [Leekyejoonella antrihumi]|uniref:hypothetical protein n=1 Tax=Leekyejoonella antrihumi TaxID=1660198 RepID=UPI001FED136B|nr:hypothetical protein [Leekyejoonella antrihumi]
MAVPRADTSLEDTPAAAPAPLARTAVRRPRKPKVYWHLVEVDADKADDLEQWVVVVSDHASEAGAQRELNKRRRRGSTPVATPVPSCGSVPTTRFGGIASGMSTSAGPSPSKALQHPGSDGHDRIQREATSL